LLNDIHSAFVYAIGLCFVFEQKSVVSKGSIHYRP